MYFEITVATLMSGAAQIFTKKKNNSFGLPIEKNVRTNKNSKI